MIAAVRDGKPVNLAVLNDVDAPVARTARVTPGNRVVADRAAAPLQQAALDREPRIVEIQERQHGADLFPIEQFCIDAMEPHGIAAPCIGVALGVRMIEVQNAALAHHGVVVEVLLQPSQSFMDHS